ncbi:MAG TPA: GNAT family N-acetyltransferase [Vicinamibacterales bacterium]|nr:GNAT family N-acetyltransferase [Vicinamibacterales bacterium]
MSPTLIGIDELKSRPASVGVPDEHEVDVESIVRGATDADVDTIHRLVSTHVTEGRLLPRSRAEIAARINRFIVAVDNGGVVGCADLAPLSRRVAEVRSLVVAGGARSCGIGRRLVGELEKRALASSFESLTAFTHTPGYFVQLGFSIVPHTWVPEKIEADCRTCAQFRKCGQYAVMLPLIRTQTTRVSSSAHA